MQLVKTNFNFQIWNIPFNLFISFPTHVLIIPAGHISFIVVKIDDQPEVHDMRIDVGLSDEDYDRCFKDDVCSFQVINYKKSVCKR